MSITPVTPVVEMLIGGTWTDITADVQLGDAEGGGGIRIKRGVPNEGTRAEPTELEFTLNNAQGKYSPRNETGVNYGRLGRNTPIRVALSRRTDLFTHNEADWWGRLPSWTDSEAVVRLGEVWRIGGSAGASSRFDIAGGEATIVAQTGTQMATFGTYGDVEILTRVKTSVRDSEFGIIMRLVDPLVFAADFESGPGGWTTTGTTTPFALSTAIVHSGTTCGSMVVAGSPGNSHLRSEAVPGTTPVTPGQTYRARAWMRCTAAQACSFVINWYDASGVLISPSSTTSFTFTANTWAVFEVSGVAPDNAVTALIGPTLTGSPPNGTVLLIDDVDFMATDQLDYYTAYITPTTTDQLRLGQISRGGANLLNGSSLSANVIVGTYYWMKAQMSGIKRRVKFWKDGDPEPSAWQTVRSDTSAAAPATARNFPKHGQVGLFVKDGTSTVTFDSVQVTVWRAHAEITELPPRWDLSRQVHWVPISARGILRRLGQGRKPTDSPMTLYLKSYSSIARSWSPLETFDPDAGTVPNLIDNGALPFARHLVGGTPDASGTFSLPGISGYADFNADDSFLSVKTKPGATPGKWSYFNVFRVPNQPPSDILLYTVNSSGTATTWKVYLQLDNQARIEAYDRFNTLLVSSTALMYFNPDHPQGCWLAANLYVFDSGGTVSWAWNYHKPGGTSFYTINGTFSGSAGTWGATTYQSTPVITGAGHLMVAQAFGYPGDLPFVTDAFARAAYGYTGEDAITRWQRVAANASIVTDVTADYAQSAQDLGPQTPGKTLDVMQECVEVDDSIMMEQRDDFGLNYRSRVSIYNQIALPVSIDAGHLVSPLEPTDDDQQVRNDVTVTRVNGGSARSVQLTGPLNVNDPEADPVNGVGTYDSAPQMNFYVDSQLQPAANWGRSKGTIDEPRYPSISMNLNSAAFDADPGLLAAVLAMDSGDMFDLLNTEVSLNPTKQMVVSYEEKFDQYEYGLTFTTKPGEVYDVGVVGQTTRLATKYASVNGFFTSGTDTLLRSNIIAPGALWVTPAIDANSFPFDVMVSGVRLRVRSVGQVLNANPYFDNGITGWDPVGTTLTYWERRLGFTRTYNNPCVRCTSQAAAADTGVTSAQASQMAVTPGETIRISAWIKPNTTTNVVCQGIFFDSSSVFVTGVTPTLVSVAANTWYHYTADIVVPASVAFMRVRAIANLNAGGICWIDDIRMMKPATYASSPQTLQVDQVPVYGVIKTINPGAPITVADPWRIAY